MASNRMELGTMEQSVVSELANIGCGHATTALAQMTGRSFSMSVPFVESIALEEVPLRFGMAEELTAGITMPIAGEVSGHVVFLVTWESARSLLQMLLGAAPDEPSAVGALEASALLEIGNIVLSSFLAATSDMTGVHLEATPPSMGFDMAACLLESVVVEASLSDHYALAIRTEIHDEMGSVDGYFLYIPCRDGLNLVFRRLGIAEAA